MMCLLVNPDPYSGTSKTVEIISASLGGVAFVALVVALFFFRKLMKKIAIIRKFQDGKQNVGFILFGSIIKIRFILDKDFNEFLWGGPLIGI